MGSGISTRGRKQRSLDDCKSTSVSEQLPDVTSSLPANLPYLSAHSDRGSSSSRESSAAARDRFKRVMHMVRKEATALEALNAEDRDRRKRLLQERITDSMKLDREKAAALRQELLAEAGLSDDSVADDETGNEVVSIRRMLLNMIGDYELSSSEDDAQEEEHDINHPLGSSDTNDALITPTSASGKESELWALKDLKVEMSSRTSEISDDEDASYHIDDMELHVVVPARAKNVNSDSECDSESAASDVTFDDHDRDEEPSEEVRGSEFTSSIVQPGVEETGSKCHYVTYTPRRSSLVENTLRAQEKQKQHVLHTIMRQESLAERKARASRKLQRRKEREKRRNAESEGIEMGEDDEVFEARKKVKKEFKAHDHMRRTSAARNESRQRESLVRRLEERRMKLQQLMLEE